LPAILYLDRFGRKKLLMAGAIGMGVAHAIVAALSATYDGKFATNPGAGWAGVAFIYFFIANFAYSWGPIGWVLPSEIFPMSARSKAMSITTSVNWLMNFVIGRATPSMLRDIKYGTYILFACCCALMFVWVWFFVPETKGKTLEEMDHVFKDTTGAEDASRMARVRKEVGLSEDGTERLDTSGSNDLEKGGHDSQVDHVNTMSSPRY
jgi:MFS family permease